MRKKTCALLLALSMLCSFMVIPTAAEGPAAMEAVYLGIKDFADSDGRNKDDFEYLFSVDGATETYKVANVDEVYALQNQLMEGYIYDITVEDGVVTDVELLDRGSDRVVMGTVDAVGEGTITVDGQTLTVEDGVKTFEITATAGGASVEEAAAAEGDSVKVTVDGTSVKTIYKTFVSEEYQAPVSGTPGQTTLKNLLATALEPVGTSLYIYGGSWDWQDENSSNQAMTIGLPQSWVDFFQAHDADYTYRDDSDPAHSYYWRHYNEYYYGGPDCSGYMGWVIYNLMHTESSTVSESAGYVGSATKQAKGFESKGWGTMDMGDVLLNEDGTPWVDEDGDGRRIYNGHDFMPGDIFSMNGHVWLCVGTCPDGSIVFVHSTPNTTNGAGAQISALGTDKSCEAYKLANYYMNKYYPEWSQRYGDQVLCLSFEGYTKVYGSTAGKFSWDLSDSGTISDPDGYAQMTPAEILADLYNSSSVIVRFESNGGSAVECQLLDKGDTAVRPADPEKNGYTFAGWYVDEALNTPYDFSKPVNENVVLYAKWDRNSSGGGSGSGSSAKYSITVETAANGSVTADRKSAAQGAAVTLTVKAEAGYQLDALTVTDAKNKTVETKEKNGKYTFTMPSSEVKVKAVFAKTTEVLFTDVADNAYYADAVKWAVEQGITSGATATTFQPDAVCTRAQAVTFLWRAMGSPEPVSNVNPFDDVAPDAYYRKAVLWAVEQGITAGTTEKTFSPDAEVTRAQTVTFLWNAAGRPAAGQANPFEDVTEDAYYSAAVLWAVAQGVTSGTTPSSFAPNHTCTRAQMVTFLYSDLAE